jgi:tRNA-Thr(GGU) m(6)t(6)A37 methyltransferase TsaA
MNSDNIQCRPIGFIRSVFTDVNGMPIQTAAAQDVNASLEVLPEFQKGLKGIEGFDYLILITHLHRSERESLEVVPFLDDQSHGVFSTRSPARPNRLGLSIINLIGVDGLILTFKGCDMLDGTPVLDIKPYVPAFDLRDAHRVGWYESRIQNLPHTRSDDRMSR